MINFIVYDSKTYREDLCVRIIKKFVYTNNERTKIYDYKRYTKTSENEIKKIIGRKIYIINLELDGITGFDLARKIRREGDIESPIIFTHEEGKIYNIKEIRNCMVLNIIEQNDNFVRELYNSITEAYMLITKYKDITFSLLDEIHRIPCDDIYYIQKDNNEDSVTIYTKDDSFNRLISIKEFSNELKDDVRFFKCHRSCIINLFKVRSYDAVTNTIYFDNDLSINLVSTRHKKELKYRIEKGTVM